MVLVQRKLVFFISRLIFADNTISMDTLYFTLVKYKVHSLPYSLLKWVKTFVKHILCKLQIEVAIGRWDLNY